MGDALEDDLPSVAIGEVIGEKYRVEGLIGSGAMGSVYRAHRLGLGAKVAIKVLRPERLHDASAQRRFYLEAKSTSRLESPHAVRTFEIDRLANGVPYIVMEHLDGDDLAAIVGKRGALPMADAVRYIIDACDAVGEAHGLSIIHRDVKPANLFLTRGGVLKVLDFGLAKDLPQILPEGGSESTKTSFLLGSPHYMSPEQLRSAKEVDARADIWSLGATLFHLIAGTPPFAGSNLYILIALIMNEEAPRLSGTLPSTPPALDAVIAKCLRRDREERFASCADLRHALEEVLANMSHPADHDDPTKVSAPRLTAATPAPGVALRSVDGIASFSDPVDDAEPTALAPAAAAAAAAAGEALPRLYDDDPPPDGKEQPGTMLMPQTIDRLLAKVPPTIPRVYDDGEDIMPNVTKLMLSSPGRVPASAPSVPAWQPGVPTAQAAAPPAVPAAPPEAVVAPTTASELRGLILVAIAVVFLIAAVIMLYRAG